MREVWSSRARLLYEVMLKAKKQGRFTLVVHTQAIVNVLMYEKEDDFKFGLEAYYVSPQLLNDGTSGRSYWTAGIMAEKIWEHISLFINLENFTNTRQTKFGPIYSGPISDPVFTDIYAPLEGRVLNGGIKVRM